jgi:hypothetical protein
LPYNLAAGISGRLKLPKVGEPLQQVFLSFLALDSGIGDAAVDLVQEALALARKKGAQAALLGLSAANPLSATLKDRLHATVYRTRIETVTWPDRQSQPVDERPPQPEIAIL